MDLEKQLYLEHLPGGIARIVWNNPPLNLTTMALMARFEQLLIQVEADNAVRVLIIAAEGTRAFCVGSDIKEFPQIADNFVEKKLRRENAVFSRIETMKKPVIAAIQSHALGGGCEMALACDFRVMEVNATIGQPEINLGTFPGSGGVFRLPRLVGPAKAMEMLCLGTALSAQQALDCGLVHRIAPAGQTSDTAYALAHELSCKAAFAIACIKQTVHACASQTPEEAVELSLCLSEEIFKTKDSAEGVRAFMEKRKPRFEGAPDTH